MVVWGGGRGMSDLTPRQEVLLDADRAVSADRNKTYGPPTKCFETIAAFWTASLHAKGLLKPGFRLRAADVAVMLAQLKLARICTSPTGAQHKDNWVDLAGYAACGYECAVEGDQR